MINKYEAFIFDLDGTIFRGEKIIENSDKVVNKIKEAGKNLIFISNNTTGSIFGYFSFLKNNGFNIVESEILNSTVILKTYLAGEHSGENFYAIGEELFIEEISGAGLKYSEDPQKIAVVLITLDRKLNHEKFDIASKALINGARFYAANIDETCPVEEGEIMDAGSIITELEKMTNLKLEKNFGKPSGYMMNTVLNILGTESDKCLLIGDRMETDIAMGNIFGMDTVLVSTGVANNFSCDEEYCPTYRINSVYDLINGRL